MLRVLVLALAAALSGCLMPSLPTTSGAPKAPVDVGIHVEGMHGPAAAPDVAAALAGCSVRTCMDDFRFAINGKATVVGRLNAVQGDYRVRLDGPVGAVPNEAPGSLSADLFVARLQEKGNYTFQIELAQGQQQGVYRFDYRLASDEPAALPGNVSAAANISVDVGASLSWLWFAAGLVVGLLGAVAVGTLSRPRP